MSRLIRLAKTRGSDPEIFAGLGHACRYCGLLRASLAAFERSRRLDPRLRTSIAITFFMLGEYERVLEFETEGIPYARNVALTMLGRQDEALDSLRTIDERIASRMVSFTSAFRLLLHGRTDESIAALAPLREIRDPEARYFVGRHLAHAGDQPVRSRLSSGRSTTDSSARPPSPEIRGSTACAPSPHSARSSPVPKRGTAMPSSRS